MTSISEFDSSVLYQEWRRRREENIWDCVIALDSMTKFKLYDRFISYGDGRKLQSRSSKTRQWLMNAVPCIDIARVMEHRIIDHGNHYAYNEYIRYVRSIPIYFITFTSQRGETNWERRFKAKYRR